MTKMLDVEFHKHCGRSVTVMGKKGCNVTRVLFLYFFFGGVAVV